jgi:2-polyprenyl-3-methyl-5-hydroxy-6-metoxy-1,4-benzoquinol methylase
MQYTERLLNCGSRLTRFAHKSRYQKICDVLSNQKYEKVVDFGCADGWFLNTAYQRGLVSGGIGIDVDAQMLAACREKFNGVDGFSFIRPDEVTESLFHSCDLAICTETLEHVSSPQEIIEQMLLFCRSGAQVIISVPIEVGPSVIVKQLGRFLSQRECASYGYEKYEFRELMQAAMFWNTSKINCSHNNSESGEKGHKGFDYRKIDALIRNRLNVERMEYSPISFMGKVLNSTVYWVCKV